MIGFTNTILRIKYLNLTEEEVFMTGAYLRVKRNGKWGNIEIEHLTDSERIEIFKDSKSYELLKWLNLVCSRLSDNEKLLKELIKDGVVKT